ncbi:hypothetical protein Q5425_34240 [Amycolatopsis sp. A133]|uniref:hypothetical protein n=1 Tax=Amycolatopsis sp. A133 TaxID=3064472 RepID=UPI0027E8F2B6|nr:hypothetical protein [Amycolatopsis sp. A133]MDQ7808824.1 hypothetical protein [Amycolatopsis sp. A133]
MPEPATAEEHELLADLRQLWADADPVPPSLTGRIRFAVRLANLESELTSMPVLLEVASVRGDGGTRVLTFERDGLAVLVNVTTGEPGTVRVDGWLAPPAAHEVELLTTAGTRTTRCDGDGRFVIKAAHAGLARLTVRPAGDGRRVATPVIDL